MAAACLARLLSSAGKAVSLSNSNPGVVSVDKNLIVIPKALGSTVITVTTEDGGFVDKEKIVDKSGRYVELCLFFV